LFKSGLSAHLDVVQIDRDLVSGKTQVVTRDLSLDLVKLVGRQVLENPKYLGLVERLLPGGMLNLIDISWFADLGFFRLGISRYKLVLKMPGYIPLEITRVCRGLSGASQVSE
jgi:hypothetical protein